MPGFGNYQEEDNDDLFDVVSATADRMGMEGEEREAYIDDHMIRGGYRRVQTRESYLRVPEEPEGDPQQGGGGGWWRSGGQRGGGQPAGRPVPPRGRPAPPRGTGDNGDRY